ncbi:hypothetical protein HDU92_005141 [Lobulomyces angularis]|nr:hypothetical protein HDU92_005141 [Lobulomyces angularis]
MLEKRSLIRFFIVFTALYCFIIFSQHSDSNFVSIKSTSYQNIKNTLNNSVIVSKNKKHGNHIQINNLNYCESFDGTILNRKVKLNALASKYYASPNALTNSDSLIRNHTEEQLVKIIDSAAIDISQTLPVSLAFEKTNFFACFTTLMGDTGFSNASIGPMLKELKTSQFYAWMIAENDKILKPRYKIAYFITAHKHVDFNNFKHLISAIYVPQETIILIHVDSKSQSLFSLIEEFVAIRKAEKKNISLLPHRFKINTKTSSLIKAQLLGFFKLLDFGSWDYLINLSATDYPLRSSTFLHQYLMKTPNKIWLKYSKDEKMKKNLEVPCFQTSCFWNLKRFSTFLDQFPSTKNTLWGYFPRKFVSYMRNSKELPILLAWAGRFFISIANVIFLENSWDPVQSFFSMIILSTNSPWKEQIVNENKRLKLREIKNHKHYRQESATGNLFFFGKIHVEKHPQIKNFADEEQKKIFI